jgi:hypothetical protein
LMLNHCLDQYIQSYKKKKKKLMSLIFMYEVLLSIYIRNVCLFVK